MARVCKQCGAQIPWGTPQCIECRSYTHWRSWLAMFGIVLGAGTVVVLFAALARVWFAEPPPAVRASAEVQRFLREVGRSEQAGHIGGAGRCKPEIAEALCVQVTEELERLDTESRVAAKRSLAARWKSIAAVNPARLVFVTSAGEVETD